MINQTSDYAARTYQSTDPLRALSHGARFRTALSLSTPPNNPHVLDFGGGDGKFLSLLKQKTSGQFSGVLFEPYMQREITEEYLLLESWDEVVAIAKDRPFDFVSCQEVMEHFTPTRQSEALERIASVLAPSGRLLLSVPVEVGPVALVKNIGRWKYRRNGKEIYNYGNLARSFYGIAIPGARSSGDFLSHMGFYYFDLKGIIEKYFVIERMVGSPFSRLPLLMNSQVFFQCRCRADYIDLGSHSNE